MIATEIFRIDTKNKGKRVYSYPPDTKWQHSPHSQKQIHGCSKIAKGIAAEEARASRFSLRADIE